MTSLAKLLVRRKADGKKSLGVFLTAGFPTKEDCLDILLAIAGSGADFVELGMPFSDPLAEGPVIQQSSQVALSNGVDLRYVLDLARHFTSRSDTPLVLMGYINPVLRFGRGNFCSSARSSGVSGLILPDLPFDELDLISEHTKAHNLDLIQLIAPTSPPNRIREIASKSTGFLYAVAVVGLTGAQKREDESVREYLQLAVSVSEIPVLAGFGIKSGADAQQISAWSDGCIVGTAIIELVANEWASNSPRKAKLASISAFVQQLSAGANRAIS